MKKHIVPSIPLLSISAVIKLPGRPSLSPEYGRWEYRLDNQIEKLENPSPNRRLNIFASDI